VSGAPEDENAVGALVDGLHWVDVDAHVAAVPTGK
jgi:hypothetical protein